jgi:hypothetical protein
MGDWTFGVQESKDVKSCLNFHFFGDVLLYGKLSFGFPLNELVKELRCTDSKNTFGERLFCNKDFIEFCNGIEH